LRCSSLTSARPTLPNPTMHKLKLRRSMVMVQSGYQPSENMGCHQKHGVRNTGAPLFAFFAKGGLEISGNIEFPLRP
jgi:hypothetical protein